MPIHRRSPSAGVLPPVARFQAECLQTRFYQASTRDVRGPALFYGVFAGGQRETQAGTFAVFFQALQSWWEVSCAVGRRALLPYVSKVYIIYIMGQMDGRRKRAYFNKFKVLQNTVHSALPLMAGRRHPHDPRGPLHTSGVFTEGTSGHGASTHPHLTSAFLTSVLEDVRQRCQASKPGSRRQTDFLNRQLRKRQTRKRNHAQKVNFTGSLGMQRKSSWIPWVLKYFKQPSSSLLRAICWHIWRLPAE